MRINKQGFYLCVLSMTVLFAFGNERTELQAVVQGLNIPDNKWVFSKDDAEAFSKALVLARQLSSHKMDDLLEKNKNPDFVAIKYHVWYKYPSIAFIWVESDKVESIFARDKPEQRGNIIEPQSLCTWYDYWENEMSNDNIPPRLVAGIKNSRLRAKQSQAMEQKQSEDVLKGHLESHKNDLANLKLKAEKKKDRTFVFKAFYLGMPIEDAALLLDILLELPPDSNVSEMVKKNKDTEKKYISDKVVGFWVESDTAGCVTEIVMLRKCVNKVFGCQGVTVKFMTENFKEQLEKSENKLVSFELDFNANANIYMSKRGYRFIIFDQGNASEQEKLVMPLDFMSTIFKEASARLDEGSISIKKVGTMNFD